MLLILGVSRPLWLAAMVTRNARHLWRRVRARTEARIIAPLSLICYTADEKTCSVGP